jgi:hypothetical protein
MFFLELENDMQGCEFYLYCIRCKEDNEARFKKGGRNNGRKDWRCQINSSCHDLVARNSAVVSVGDVKILFSQRRDV